MERLTTKNEHRQLGFGEYAPNWKAIYAMTGRGTQDYSLLVKVAIDRLAQYEETGLTPEDVVAMRDTAFERIKVPQTLIELEKAEKEGRIVRLPCKVGDMVWCVRGIKRFKHVVQRRVQRITIRGENAFELHTTIDEMLGQTAFLTEEEAQKKADQMNQREVRYEQENKQDD